MEWEVMFLCNMIGVLLLVFITLFHLIGVDKEKNGEVIDTSSEGANTGVSVSAGNGNKK